MHSILVAMFLPALVVGAEPQGLDRSNPLEVERSWPKVVVVDGEPAPDGGLPLTRWIVVAEPMEKVGEHERAGVVRVLDAELVERWSVSGDAPDQRLGVYLSEPARLADGRWLVVAAEHGGDRLALRRIVIGNGAVEHERREVDLPAGRELCGPIVLPDGTQALFAVGGGAVSRVVLTKDAAHVELAPETELDGPPTRLVAIEDVTGDGIRDVAALRERGGLHDTMRASAKVLDGATGRLRLTLVLTFEEPLWPAERSGSEHASWTVARERSFELRGARARRDAPGTLVLTSVIQRASGSGTEHATSGTAIAVQVNTFAVPAVPPAAGDAARPEPPHATAHGTCLDFSGGSWASAHVWSGRELCWEPPDANWGWPVFVEFPPYVFAVLRDGTFERSSTEVAPTFQGEYGGWPEVDDDGRPAWIGGGTVVRLAAAPDARVVAFAARGVARRFAPYRDMLDGGGQAARGADHEGAYLVLYDIDRMHAQRVFELASSPVPPNDE